MPNLARRTVAAGSLVAVLSSGLTACGGKGSSSAPNPTPTAAVQQSFGSGDPFSDIRAAAAHMPDIADALAAGIAKADSPTASPAPTPKSAAISGDPDSAAAGLDSKLEFLLTEHVYLAGLAVATMYHFGPEADQFNKATAALDANASDVDSLIATVDAADKDSFLQSWRQHDTDVLTYARAAKQGGSGGSTTKAAEQKNLAAYARSAGTFFNKMSNGQLSAGTVTADFTVHVSSLAAAIDAMAAGSPDAFKLLKTAAADMTTSAAYLSGGIARSANLTGETGSKAAKLRAGLTGLLTAHVYLAGSAIDAAYSNTGATDSPIFVAAKDTLDTNSQDLATAIGQVAGVANQAKFLQTWRTHIDDFVKYAQAEAGLDSGGKAAALADLDAYRTAAGNFFSDITGGAISASLVAEALKDHIQSLSGAIDSLKTAVLDAPVSTPPSFGPFTPETVAPTAVPTTEPTSPPASPTATASPSVTATSKPKKTATPTPSATSAAVGATTFSDTAPPSVAPTP